MTRLPSVGADYGQWGTLLLDFLRAAHNENGSLRADAIPDAAGRGEINVLGYALGQPIGDGASRPLSGLFATLGAARGVFPHATALTDELGWAAIQAAIVAGRSAPTGPAYGRPLYLPPGTYVTNRPLDFANLRGGVFAGAGGPVSTLRWAGDALSAAILVQNCREMQFRNFGIGAGGNAPLLCGISQARTASSGVWAPTHNRYDNILIDGGVGGASSGVYTAFASGAAIGLTPIGTNNDFTLWTNCVAANYRDRGWWLDNSQNYYNEMRHCRAAGSGAQYGVYQTGRASFTWTGGGLFGHTAADFWLADPNPYSIARLADLTSESSARLLSLNSYNGGSVVLDGVRYTGDAVDPDGTCIQAPNFVGHLAVQDSHFLERHPTRRLRIAWNQTPPDARAAGATFVFERNIWWQNGSYRVGAPANDPAFWATNRPTSTGAGNAVKDEGTMASLAMT